MQKPALRTAIPPATNGRRVWLRVGTLLDGTSAKPLHNAHVVYDEKEILFVGENSPPSNLLDSNQHEPDLDLTDFTLLPGLIEAHAHLFLEGGELDLHRRALWLKQTPEIQLQAARSHLEKLVRLGIVAVRDAGDKHGVGLALSKLYRNTGRAALPRRQAERQLGPTKFMETEASIGSSGEIHLLTSTLRSIATEDGSAATLMPYVDSPGTAIHHKGRYGSLIAEPIENFASPKECVEARVKAGADRIKLIPTGIINFKQGKVTAEPQMTTAEISGLVAAAKSFGKQTFAHASGDTGIERAIEGGMDSIEHGYFVQANQLAKMRDRQIAWVPTFAPVQAQIDHANLLGWDDKVVSNLKNILDQHAASLVKAHEMGVPIIAGSDAGAFGVAHGMGFLNELELMERVGLPSLLVINAATGTSSNRLAFKEKFGLIKPGYQSRFILTRHSPLESVSNLRKQIFVVFDGVVFESNENVGQLS
jgi:imidazolonepropionase-like amidohydrolase